MTYKRIVVEEFDSPEDGGPDAPQAQYKIEVHVDGKPPETTWTNSLKWVCEGGYRRTLGRKNMKIKFQAAVVSIEEKSERVHTGGVGEAATFKDVSRGWWVCFAGSYESIFVSDTKPATKVGDVATIVVLLP